MRSHDIIIVGAGVIGAATVWRLRLAGYGVTLIDDPGASPASEVAAGMLAPVTEAEFGAEKLLQLNLRSNDMYSAFVDELVAATGRDVGYRRCGTVMVARDTDDRRMLDEIFAYQERLGLEVARLSSRELRAQEPVLSPRVVGGVSVAGDHQIDPPALLGALIAAAGGPPVQDRVVELVQERSSVEVRMASGAAISGDAVVLAAGSYTGSIAGATNPPIPIRPVKGQLVHLKERSGVSMPRANIRGLDVYIVTRTDGRVVVGATVEEQGFDRTLTAGAVHDLLRAAYELWPGLVELEFTGVTAGLRPATPDNSPVIGKLGDRVIVAAGHFRNGVLLAPATATAVLELVEGREPEWIADFHPDRFGAPIEVTR